MDRGVAGVVESFDFGDGENAVVDANIIHSTLEISSCARIVANSDILVIEDGGQETR